MSFSSPFFIFIFLPVVASGYFVCGLFKFQNITKIWLSVASLFFIAYANIYYVPLILFSVSVNFFIGSLIERVRTLTKNDFKNYNSIVNKKAFLFAGIIFNLALLGYFKYSNFFIDNLNEIFNTDIQLLQIILPLGISYFSFQQIAYLVHVNNGSAVPQSILDYILFVIFFPQLAAGPIVYQANIVPQFIGFHTESNKWNNISIGTFILCVGLFKKLCIADSFAIWANKGFNNVETLSFFEAWGTSLSYTFQLYYDFSGYSDMAIGAARIFNIQIPVNFDSPYKALDIQEFWRRWHITLSLWLRDFLYIPFGGNRRGVFRTYLNLILTFLLAGLWHGAGWTFVLWGGMHGAALIIHRIWKSLGLKMGMMSSWFITFMFVNLAWVFFRANTISDGFAVLKGMCGFNGIIISKEFANAFNWFSGWDFLTWASSSTKFVIPIQAAVYIAIYSLITFFAPNSGQLIGLVPYNGRMSFKYSYAYVILMLLLFLFSISRFMGNVSPTEFIYFNF